MKFIILSLGTYVDTNQSRAITAFSQLGVNQFEMFYQWFALPSYLGKALDYFRGPALLVPTKATAAEPKIFESVKNFIPSPKPELGKQDSFDEVLGDKPKTYQPSSKTDNRHSSLSDDDTTQRQNTNKRKTPLETKPKFI